MIIDGRRITPRAGASILETAREVGSAIPTLCHHPSLPPDASCRMCLVEVDGRSGLHPACAVCAVGIEPAAEAAR
jgi:NADH dehydrogenase/NADH:ubiquinone oxidoreductase subunit G